MTVKEIFENNKIEYFCAIKVSCLKVGNERLYAEVPENAYAIFALFPYYVKMKNSYLAAFAAVPDYHIFARELFSEITEHIKNKYPSVSFARGYTDHSPFEERDGAAKCALGIIGQNGLLINEKYSSFVTIGEFVSDLSEEELTLEGVKVYEGEIKYCEDCGLCKKACNSLCSLENKAFCLSALTQKKGEPSEAEKEIIKSGGSAWGCDKCQLACPHTKNAFEKGTVYTENPFFGRNVICGGLDEIEKLTDEEYRKYTFSYRKRSIMKRNIEILREK